MLTMTVTIEQMRSMIRISHDKLDDELNMFLGAYLIEMENCGVDIIPDDDMLALATLELYLRWRNNYNSEAERYDKSYQAAKIAMSLAGKYREVTE